MLHQARKKPEKELETALTAPSSPLTEKMDEKNDKQRERDPANENLDRERVGERRLVLEIRVAL
jgi:hypothetical protein